jgi:hypothetical protein
MAVEDALDRGRLGREPVDGDEEELLAHHPFRERCSMMSLNAGFGSCFLIISPIEKAERQGSVKSVRGIFAKFESMILSWKPNFNPSGFARRPRRAAKTSLWASL